jgi:phospholipase/carboxylesterase
MQAEPQSGRSLVYLTIYPDGYDEARRYPLVILLHGVGAHMYDLASLASEIDPAGYLYVCPNAPIPYLIGPGRLGYSWRPPQGADTSTEGYREQSARVEQQVEDFFQEVMERYDTTPGHVLLVGFSQGGGLTYHHGLPRPDTFAGLAALSCSIRDPDTMSGLLPEKRDQPIFIAHGLRDNPDRGRRSRDFLEAEGYSPDYHEYDIAHEISQQVVQDLSHWMHRVLPP